MNKSHNYKFIKINSTLAITLFLIFIILIYNMSVNASEIYTWTDEDGVVHFDDISLPKDANSSETIEYKKSKPQGTLKHDLTDGKVTYEKLKKLYPALDQSSKQGEYWKKQEEILKKNQKNWWEDPDHPFSRENIKKEGKKRMKIIEKINENREKMGLPPLPFPHY
jgi:hypothetical protein